MIGQTLEEYLQNLNSTLSSEIIDKTKYIERVSYRAADALLEKEIPHEKQRLYFILSHLIYQRTLSQYIQNVLTMILKEDIFKDCQDAIFKFREMAKVDIKSQESLDLVSEHLKNLRNKNDQ